MSDIIFVVNAGSSSIKFKMYEVKDGVVANEANMTGLLDGIGVRPHIKVKDLEGGVLLDESFTAEEIPNATEGKRILAEWLRPRVGDLIIGIGHRVVHGGPNYSEPVLIDDKVMETLESFVSLAPLHQLSNLDPIKLMRERRPDLPQVACFDTAFHRDHPEISDRLPIPRHFYDEGVRRYGFHGLSYEYVSGRLRTLAPAIGRGKVVIAHLGSGASVCGLKNGHSIESTMGFTALDGVPMGTRSGSLDPGVVLHLIEEKGMSAHDVGTMLYRQSGLLGLSGISNDVRDLLASPEPAAAMALDYFCLKVAQAVTKLATAIGGLDGLVFTAGIGENSPEVRKKVCDLLGWVGVELDEDANETRGATLISKPGSKTTVFMVPTDEERMIAIHTLRLLRGTGHI